jgi:two-component system chemotaxis response regulator CheB
MEKETEMAEFNIEALEDEERRGAPSVFAWPECGGALWEMRDGDLFRFRCRVGHAFSAESLLSAQKDQLEGALWAALRALEENTTLSRRLAIRARARNLELSAANFEERARTAEHHAGLIRQALLNDKNAVSTEEEKKEEG